MVTLTTTQPDVRSTTLLQMSTTGKMSLFGACRDNNTCDKGLYCDTGDNSCQPCSALCNGFDRDLCDQYCQDTEFVTYSPTTKRNRLSALAVTSLFSTPMALLGTRASSPLPPSDGQHPGSRNEAQLTFYLSVAAVVSVLFVVIILAVVAFIIMCQLRKRKHNYKKNMELGAHAPLVPKQQQQQQFHTANISPATSVLKHETELLTNQKRTRHVSTSTCSIDSDNESTHVPYEPRTRHASTCTSCDSLSDTESINSSTAILVRRESKGVAVDGQRLTDIPEEESLRKSGILHTDKEGQQNKETGA